MSIEVTHDTVVNLQPNDRKQLVAGGGGTKWRIQGKIKGQGELVLLDGNSDNVLSAYLAPCTFDTGVLNCNWIMVEARNKAVQLEYMASH